MAKIKKRLDTIVSQMLPDYDERFIYSLIVRGKVSVDNQIVIKPGTQIDAGAKITYVIEEKKYVSRAGLKLEKALDFFCIDVKGFVVLDAGISTGGFTDCLLQYGARKVYGVDVGYGDVHDRIRRDERLVLLEKTNLRLLEGVGELVDLITLDLSFISILAVMNTVTRILKNHGKLVALIKPQFEAGKHEIGTGGIVRDDTLRKTIVDAVVAGIERYGFTAVGVTQSPISGIKGNREFLAYFKKNNTI